MRCAHDAAYYRKTVAPETAPQVFTTPLNGVAHPLAPQVLAALGKNRGQPVSFWRVINTLANQQNAASRAHRRSWRLRFLCAVRDWELPLTEMERQLEVSSSGDNQAIPVDAIDTGFTGIVDTDLTPLYRSLTPDAFMRCSLRMAAASSRKRALGPVDCS